MSVIACQEPKLNEKNNDPFHELKVFLETCVNKNINLFSHKFLDPDGLGAMVGLDWLLQRHYGIENITCFSDGPISNPQNIAMVELLSPPLTDIKDFSENNKQVNILLDTMPSYAGIGDKKIEFDAVIDHHKDNGNGYHNILINLNAGSCCGTVYALIKSHGISFDEENEDDSRVATALMVGILTDTDGLLSDDCSDYEFDAYPELFKHRNLETLKRVIKYKKPLNWAKIESKSVQDVKIRDGVAVVGLGFLNEKQRDIVPQIASEMIGWESVELSVAFAVLDGNLICGSIRSNDASVSVTNLAKQITGKNGNGGGKLNKGAYQIPLGILAIEDDDGDQIKNNMLKSIEDKEIERIFRLAKK